MRQTHHQPGGEVCESATLPDGRVIRVVGYEMHRSVTAELRAWLVWLGLALLWGCGGPVFSTEVGQPVGAIVDPSVDGSADSSPMVDSATLPDVGRDAGADAASEVGMPEASLDGSACVTAEAPDGGWDCGGGPVGGSVHPYDAWLCVAINGAPWTPQQVSCGSCVSCETCNLAAVCSGFRPDSGVIECSEQGGEVIVDCN